MITGDQNSALLLVGNAALHNPNWHEFAEYCFKREHGLRKTAFKNLEQFIVLTKSWNELENIDFLKFLFPYFENTIEAHYAVFPQPLKDFIQPILIHWCTYEKISSTPFRWYGRYFEDEEYLLKALDTDHQDHIARESLVRMWAYQIYFSMHHLPKGYIVDLQYDTCLADKLKEQIQLLPIEERINYTAKFEEDFEILNNYIEWRQSGHQDFEIWGLQNKKRIGY